MCSKNRNYQTNMNKLNRKVKKLTKKLNIIIYVLMPIHTMNYYSNFKNISIVCFGNLQKNNIPVEAQKEFHRTEILSKMCVGVSV